MTVKTQKTVKYIWGAKPQAPDTRRLWL